MDAFEQAKNFFLTGIKHLENGELQDAEDSFLESLRLAPNRASTLNNLASTQIKLKKLDEAEIHLKEVIGIDNKSIDLWLNLGILYLEKNQLTQAVSFFENCLELDPQFILAWKLIAQVYDKNREFNKAISCFKNVLEVIPNDLDALIGIGAILNDLKEYDASIRYHKLAIQAEPTSIIGYVNIGVALHGIGKYDLALHNYFKALDLAPFDVEILLNSGVALHSLKRYDEALAHYDKALTLKPDYHEAWSNKGNTLHQLNRYDEALAHYDKALTLKPDYAEGWSNKGITLYELERYDEALAHYDKALTLKPDYAEGWSNKGITLQEIKHYDEALAHYDKALSLKPDYAEGWSNKGITLQELKRYDEALAHYDKALSLKPDIDWVLGEMLDTKMKICSWFDLADSVEIISKNVMANKKAAMPFTLLAINDDGLLQKKSSEIYVQSKYPLNLLLGPILKRPENQKIRVGYFSADFRIHPISFLTAELYELHDRDRFEIIAFSFGVDDKSQIRFRLSQAFDQFIDVSSMSDLDVAKLSRNLQVDIAVDLGGYTNDSRTGIFSYRAAPIQVSYLGYLGTMGAEYIDYILADKTIIPEGLQKFYTEKIAYLPSYQANDRKRTILDRKFIRKELGLPENGFIYCCFNNNFKILPTTFDGWVRILKAVEGSTLFLYAENKRAEENLKKEAKVRGIDSTRLVFGGRMPNEEYLARYRACDLFLDTSSYNAGTTASDALWTGLPVLTLMGQSFASRVAASLLNAIGLPELITNTQKEYEALAIELAMNPKKLGGIKLKLANNRLTTPLFNTPLFTKNLEAVYIKMYERYQADLPLDHISII